MKRIWEFGYDTFKCSFLYSKRCLVLSQIISAECSYQFLKISSSVRGMLSEKINKIKKNIDTCHYDYNQFVVSITLKKEPKLIYKHSKRVWQKVVRSIFFPMSLRI